MCSAAFFLISENLPINIFQMELYVLLMGILIQYYLLVCFMHDSARAQVNTFHRPLTKNTSQVVYLTD